MKTFKQSYPRRGQMLKTPFEPLTDDAFRHLVTTGAAVPGHQGSVLFVSKWRDGPGMDVESFLTALRAQGSSLEARTFQTDVNVRVIRKDPGVVWGQRALPPTSRPHA
jgi:hypothetical protein